MARGQQLPASPRFRGISPPDAGSGSSLLPKALQSAGTGAGIELEREQHPQKLFWEMKRVGVFFFLLFAFLELQMGPAQRKDGLSSVPGLTRAQKFQTIQEVSHSNFLPFWN